MIIKVKTGLQPVPQNQSSCAQILSGPSRLNNNVGTDLITSKWSSWCLLFPRSLLNTPSQCHAQSRHHCVKLDSRHRIYRGFKLAHTRRSTSEVRGTSPPLVSLAEGNTHHQMRRRPVCTQLPSQSGCRCRCNHRTQTADTRSAPRCSTTAGRSPGTVPGLQACHTRLMHRQPTSLTN